MYDLIRKFNVDELAFSSTNFRLLNADFVSIKNFNEN